MNREVYSYLLKTYGRRPEYWFGVAAVIVQTLLMRVVSVIVIARIASSVATGNFQGAKHNILLYFGVAVAGLIFRLTKDLVAIKAENQVYCGLMSSFYKKLVGKDMSFFRDHQTGYLASMFRQHVDSTMELVRLFRGEIIQTTISLTIPAVVLIVASWKVGLAALAVVIVQIFYVLWSSSAVHKYRAKAHEAYRKASGAVSDDVTNIVAYKTSGSSKTSIARIATLAREEMDAFWGRRKRLAFLDTPRDLITIAGTALAFWMIVTNAESAVGSVGLVVLTVTYMFQIFNNITNLPDIITKHDDLVTKLYPTLEYITDKYEVIKDPEHPRKLAITNAQIDINNVSFSYPDTKGDSAKVFDNLNLHIPGG